MRRTLAGAALPLVLVALTACSPSSEPTASSSTEPPPTPQTTVATASPTSARDPRPEQRNDLAKGSLQRTLSADGVRVTVTYTAATPTTSWTPDGPKALRLTATVSQGGGRARKVYVTRCTLSFAVDDGVGDVDGPDPLVDTANITPGYLATSPYSYSQSFAVPDLDQSSVGLTLNLKLELASLVDAKAKDYTKQTVTDAVHAALGS